MAGSRESRARGWTATGTSAAGIDVYLLDGETGMQLGAAHIAEMVFDGYGIYGRLLLSRESQAIARVVVAGLAEVQHPR